MKLLKVFIRTLSLLAVLAVVVTPSKAAAQITSVAGDWDATMNTPGGPRPFKILFKQDSAKLSGTVKRATGDVALEGTIAGKEVKFSYTIVYNDNPLVMSVTATLDAAGAMKGSVSFGGQAQEDFSAVRAKAP